MENEIKEEEEKVKEYEYETPYRLAFIYQNNNDSFVYWHSFYIEKKLEEYIDN